MSEIILPRRFKGQPQRIARVNYHHRLMRGAGYVFSVQDGTPVLQTPSWYQQFGDPNGGGVITTRGRGYGSANIYSALDESAAVQSTGDPHTILGVWRQVDGTNGGLSFGQSNNSNPNTIRLWGGGTPQYDVYLGGYRSLSADSAPAVGSIYSFAGVHTGSAQYTILNGKRQTATGAFSTGGLGAGYTGFALANYPGYAILLFGVIFRGVASDSVIAELGTDYEQVFKAPARRLWAVSAAAPGGSFNPAWALNANVMIGAGAFR